MRLFAIGIEYALDMAVQRSHEPHARHHRRTTSRDEQQNLDRGLPFRQVGFLLWQLRDVVGYVLQRDELATVRQRYRILEFSLRAAVSHQANRSAPAAVNLTNVPLS